MVKQTYFFEWSLTCRGLPYFFYLQSPVWAVLSLQLCPTLCFPMDHSLPGSSGRTFAMDFSRQKYWSGLPCPPPGDLPNQGIKLGTSYILLAGGFFITSATWGALTVLSGINYLISHFTPLFCLYHCCNLSVFCCASMSTHFWRAICSLTGTADEYLFLNSPGQEKKTFITWNAILHAIISHLWHKCSAMRVMLWNSPFPT